jgi:hypothetical protein
MRVPVSQRASHACNSPIVVRGRWLEVCEGARKESEARRCRVRERINGSASSFVVKEKKERQASKELSDTPHPIQDEEHRHLKLVKHWNGQSRHPAYRWTCPHF